MIKIEIVNNLKHTYSDSGYKIKQEQTDVIYSEAWDVKDSTFTYVETNELIESEMPNEEKQ